MNQAAASLKGSTVDDAVTLAERLLRKARPKLPPAGWVCLLQTLRAAGAMTLAAQIARLARTVCPKLSKLRAFPRLAIPCPLPEAVLKKLQHALRSILRSLPSFDRAAGFAVALNRGKVQWTKSAMADALLAPNVPDFRSMGSCSCGQWSGPRLHGHLVTRD